MLDFKAIVTEIKNGFNGLISGLGMVEGRISELENIINRNLEK